MQSETNKESKNIPTPVDCTNMSVERIVAAICSQVNLYRDSGNIKNSSFYAGICKDVEDNMKRHCNEFYVALCRCKDRKTAGDVEIALGELKFDVGARPDNGGDEETTIVYVIKIDRNFKR